MEFCPKCGTKLYLKGGFCENCGHEIDKAEISKKRNVNMRLFIVIALVISILAISVYCFFGRNNKYDFSNYNLDNTKWSSIYISDDLIASFELQIFQTMKTNEGIKIKCDLSFQCNSQANKITFDLGKDDWLAYEPLWLDIDKTGAIKNAYLEFNGVNYSLMNENEIIDMLKTNDFIKNETAIFGKEIEEIAKKSVAYYSSIFQNMRLSFNENGIDSLFVKFKGIKEFVISPITNVTKSY